MIYPRISWSSMNIMPSWGTKALQNGSPSNSRLVREKDLYTMENRSEKDGKGGWIQNVRIYGDFNSHLFANENGRKNLSK